MNMTVDEVSIGTWQLMRDRWVDFLNNGVYVLLGSLLVLCNVLICAAVVRHPALRRKKEYIMVAALSLADVIDGLGFVIAGVYRTSLIMTGTDGVLVTAWQCMISPHSPFFIYGQQISAMMLVCVNIDRLVAVLFPLVYFNRLGMTYTLGLITSFYALAAFVTSFAWIISYTSARVPQYKQICYLGYTYDRHELYSKVYQNVRMSGGILSVVLFLIVLCLLRRKRSNVESRGKVVELTTNAKKQREMQRRMTKTIGLSSLFTFLLFVIPSFVKLWLEVAVDSSDIVYAIGIPMTASLSNLNAIMNFLIYSVRHRDIRYGIIYLLRGKCIDEPELARIMNKQRNVSVGGNNTTQQR